MTASKPRLNEALALEEKIKPLLSGVDPSVVGATLADLLAMLLAGHIVPGNQKATHEMRERLLMAHVMAVRALIPPNEAKIRGQIEEARSREGAKAKPN